MDLKLEIWEREGRGGEVEDSIVGCRMLLGLSLGGECIKNNDFIGCRFNMMRAHFRDFLESLSDE